MFLCTNTSVYCLTSSSLQTVVTCLRIDWNKRWNWTWGILCHSSYSLCCNCRRKFWSGWCMPIRLSNWSQRWSMGFTPGDTDGQGNTVKFWSRRMSTVVRSGVVVLKNLSLSLSEFWWLEKDEAGVSRCDTSVPLNCQEQGPVAPVTVRNSTPNHYTAPTESVKFYHTAVCKSLICFACKQAFGHLGAEALLFQH